MRKYLVFLVIPVVFIIDRFTKVLIINYLEYLEGIAVAPFFSIVHARNTGGAFSLLAQHPYANIYLLFCLLL